MNMREEMEYERIKPAWERECWREFCKYHAATVNAKFAVEGGIPAPALPTKPAKGNDGWTTEVQFLTAADDVTDAELDAESNDEGFSDSAKERRWQRAIFSMLSGKTHAKVAADAAVSSRQLSRWKGDPEFIKAYEETKSKVFKESVEGMKGILIAGGIEGAKTLLEIATDKEASDTARTRAGHRLTELALQISELETLAADVAMLKAQRG
jgi:hypothetical protein